MSTEAYAGFLQAIGHRVVQTDTTWWFNVYGGVYMNFPFHRPVVPHKIEVEKLLGLSGLVARYTCPLSVGRRSYQIICDTANYDLENLSGNVRSKVRRGLKRCEVRPLAFEELDEAGAIELNSDTLVRQGRPVPHNLDAYWRRYYRAASNVPTAETWGAFVDRKLAAYLVAFRIEDCSNIFILRSSRTHLNAYPNNALMFVYLREALARPNITHVSFGLEPIQGALDSLDHFKSEMGFIHRPIGQRIVMNRMLAPLIGTQTCQILGRLAMSQATRERISKFVGMARWYAEQPKCH